MNKDLTEIIETYATKPHKELNNLLLLKSKQNIISILVDLLTIYFNDRNSSTLREFVTVSLSGFLPSKEKLGYNGYRHNGINGNAEYCEAKPKNINTNDAKPKKLDGGGNFTDYTLARFNKHRQENPTMLIAGFIDGKLIYIFRFSFDSEEFTNRLNDQLKRKFPDGDRKGDYLRSASFGFNNYKNIPELKAFVFISLNELENYQNHITRQLYDYLHNFIQNHA